MVGSTWHISLYQFRYNIWQWCIKLVRSNQQVSLKIGNCSAQVYYGWISLREWVQVIKKLHRKKDQKSPVRSSHTRMINQWEPGVWTVEKLQVQQAKKRILSYLCRMHQLLYQRDKGTRCYRNTSPYNHLRWHPSTQDGLHTKPNVLQGLMQTLSNLY